MTKSIFNFNFILNNNDIFLNTFINLYLITKQKAISKIKNGAQIYTLNISVWT